MNWQKPFVAPRDGGLSKKPLELTSKSLCVHLGKEVRIQMLSSDIRIRAAAWFNQGAK
jgi:hypothetical protein